jgi:hypothetical protein
MGSVAGRVGRIVQRIADMTHLSQLPWQKNVHHVVIRRAPFVVRHSSFVIRR